MNYTKDRMMIYRRYLLATGLILTMALSVVGCGLMDKKEVVSPKETPVAITTAAVGASEESSVPETTVMETTVAETEKESSLVETTEDATNMETPSTEETAGMESSEDGSLSEETKEGSDGKEEDQGNHGAWDMMVEHEVEYDTDWKYADFSAIHDSSIMFYPSTGTEPKNITVCVNAGHGTRGGSGYSTYSHPDQSPKCTSGTNAAGAVKGTAIAEGTTLDDGTPEYVATLELALIVKEKLLEAGYHVLMIRETEDVQLDNIARTVFANNNADCHIAIHYDSTSYDKGAFYCSVPDNNSYRSMEPVASLWQSHNRLGDCLMEGFRSAGRKIWNDGTLEQDLTQTSFSTIPSVDLEVGDQASDRSQESLQAIAEGIVEGLNRYWE